MSTLRVNNVAEAGGAPVITSGVLDSGSLPAGSVLQIVSTTKTDAFSTSSTSFTDITGLSVSITPSSTSSKILVFFTVQASHPTSGGDLNVNLVRDSTSILVGTSGTSENVTGYTAQSAAYEIAMFNNSYLDSPATTSALTYKMQFKVAVSTGYVNRRADSSYLGFPSTITVMEIAG